MTASIRTSLARAGATALLLLGGLVGASHAAVTMTPAGTPINNAAKLDYSVGGTTQTQICSSPTGNNTITCTQTTFVVDNKVNVLVTAFDTAAVSAVPGANATLTFTVSNTGNNTQDFVLAPRFGTTYGSVTLGGTPYSRTFDPSTGSCSLFDTTGAAIAGNRITNLANETSVNVKVVCTMPSTNNVAPNVGNALVNTDIAIVSLKATAYGAGGGAIAANSASNVAGTVDTVLADGAGSDSDDAANDGTYTARDAFKVQTAALTVKKLAATLCDPVNGSTTPMSIPGAYVRYTVTIANAGTAGTQSAVLTNFLDALDTSKVTFDTEFIKGTGVAANCATGTAAESSGNAVQVKLTGGTRSFSGGSKYLTAATAYSGGNLTLPWSSILPNTDATYAAGELKAGESLDVIFNVIIK